MEVNSSSGGKNQLMEHPWETRYVFWMAIRGEDKAVVLQMLLERGIDGELLHLCSAVVLGAAVGISG